MEEPARDAGSVPPRRTNVVIRVIVVLAILVSMLLFGGLIAGSADNTKYPTCSAVHSGSAQLPASGNCFKNAKWQAYGGLVFSILSGIAALIGLVLSLVWLFTGTRGAMVLRLMAGALVLAGIGLLVTHA